MQGMTERKPFGSGSIRLAKFTGSGGGGRETQACIINSDFDHCRCLSKGSFPISSSLRDRHYRATPETQYVSVRSQYRVSKCVHFYSLILLVLFGKKITDLVLVHLELTMLFLWCKNKMAFVICCVCCDDTSKTMPNQAHWKYCMFLLSLHFSEM